MVVGTSTAPVYQWLAGAVVVLVLCDVIRAYQRGSGLFAASECRLTGNGEWLLLLQRRQEWVDARLIGHSVFANWMVLRFRDREGHRQSVWIQRDAVGVECWRRLRCRLHTQQPVV